MTQFTVQMNVPLSCGGIAFDQWIPESASDAISFEEGIYSFELKTRRSAFFDSSVRNNFADVVDVRCNFLGSPDEAEYAIAMSGRRRNSGLSLRNDSLEEKTERLFHILFSKLNRLIDYLRAYHEHYWLVHFDINETFLADLLFQYDAQVTIDEAQPIAFRPQIKNVLTIKSGETKSVRKCDWQCIGHYVNSDCKIPSLPSRLTLAYQLAVQGFRTAALTESLAALEAAVKQFPEHAEKVIVTDKLARLGIESLSAYVNRLGVSTTALYLYPLLFTDEQLPKVIVDDCEKAIEVRNNIIHTNQRDVDPKLAFKSIAAAREYCKLLAPNSFNYANF